tara:strand:- start:527 stop:772 length:246 start_codon:yes stop_codon:yes gene_type:complete
VRKNKMMIIFFILGIRKTNMDRNESIYFDDFSKKSIEEVRELFKNLKSIGLSDEEIEKYAVQYKMYFERLDEERKKLNPSS